MKILKGLLCFIIGSILIILIGFLSVITQTKSIIEDQVVESFAKGAINLVKENEDAFMKGVKDQVKEELQDEINEELQDELDDLNLEEIPNSEELANILESIVNEYANFVANPEEFEVDPEIVDSVVDYMVENEKEIKQVFDVDYDVEEIQTEEFRQNLTKEFNEGFEEFNTEVAPAFSEGITVYNKIISTEVRNTVIVMIIVLSAIFILLSLESFKWLRNYGLVLLFTGINVLTTFKVFGVLVEIIQKELDISLGIDVQNIFTIGLIESVIGLCAFIGYFFLGKNTKKDTYTNDIESINNIGSTNNVENNSIPVNNESTEITENNEITENDNDENI